MRYKRCAAFIMFIAGLFVATPVFATTYSRDVEVKFTFNSEIQIDIDTADIEILDLTPGQQKDSNIVNISVSTNNVAGYTVSATTGNTTYNNTDMTHSDGVNKFTSISTDASESTLSTDNTWGYSTSMDSGTTWANFSGLPIYTDVAKEIAKTDGPSTDLTKFKIHAKASASQPAGDYRNVINFNVVANVPPRDWEDVDPCLTDSTKCDSETGRLAIQNVNEEVCNLVETFDTQYQVTDLRDHKDYWISKLRDGNCWMTQNLDLDLKAGVALTSEKTDLGWNGSSYDTASWTPNKTTYHYQDESGDIIDSSGASPYSFDPGDYYEQGTYFAPQICNYLTDESSTCISATMDPINGTHGHVGNYYTWAAAVATDNGTAINTGKMENSICPRNWRLPVADTTSSDFANINNIYNSSNNSDQGLFESPIYFIRGGYISSGTAIQAPGPLSNYWSGVSSSNGVAYQYFYGGGGSPNTSSTSLGKNVEIFARCITRKTGYYSISFNANGGTGTMSAQQIPSGSSAHLPANTFTKDGYYFNGWNTKADGSGTGYGDKSLYQVAKNSTGEATLYAQWTTTPPICTEDCDGDNPKYESGITIQRAYELAYTEHRLGMYEEQHEGQGDYARVNSWPPENEPYKGYDVRFAMQDIHLTYRGTKVCDLVTVIGDEYQALDIRDNKLYWIAKLADGSCWMTQNLDLDLVHVANDNNALYTSENTDIGYGTDHSITKWNPSSSTIPNTNILSNGRINEWCNSNNTPCSVDAGDWYWTDAWYAFNSYTSYNYLAGNQGDKFFRSPTGSGMHGHVGNYYNWTAAIASNSSPSYESGTYSNPSLNPQNSICPAGWRLPIITSYTEHQLGANDFYNLAYKYGDTLNNDQYYTSSPLWFVRGGLVNLYELDDAGEWSWYASSTVVSGSISNYALDTTNYVNVEGSNARNIGYSVRCLAR